MRVAIDARKIHDFGVGTYIRNLLRHLALIDQDSEYVLLCREPDLGIAAQLGPNFRSVLEPSPGYSVREQFHVPWVLHRERPDVFHAPHYILPVGVRSRSVVTIHDCIHLLFPEYVRRHVVSRRAARLYARTSMWLAARRSDRILTGSEASKRDILRLFDVPPDKIEVVYHAIDEHFAVTPGDERVAQVRERYQLHHTFALYVGSIRPHKNLLRLIEAFHELRSSGLDDLQLLIIGDEISKLPGLRRAVHRHKLHKHVRFLGYVADDTLAVLYRLASVFVFPSLYEGFGLPPLEAMASGTPVVTSNVSSLPEVAGDAAIFVDPYDVASIVDGMRRVLTDPAAAESLRRKGLRRAREFSWERSVRKTLEVYRAVGGGKPGTRAPSPPAAGEPAKERVGQGVGTNTEQGVR